MTMKGYVHVISKLAYFLKAKGDFYHMRLLKWEPLFNPKAETTITLAGISFSALPPNFFAKESLLSVEKAIGTPLYVDMAT
ncbi:hypothetical protein HAX54_038445, partial [Datura stramonium]|nr:hypothetical protein [Datura stramonium]